MRPPPRPAAPGADRSNAAQRLKAQLTIAVQKARRIGRRSLALAGCLFIA